MINSELLKQIDDLKKLTFTNEKIALELNVSVSTVKRALRLINLGALLSPMQKFGMTGDVYFWAQETKWLGQKCVEREPGFVNKRLYRKGEAEVKWVRKDWQQGIIRTVNFHVDPANEIEKRWLKEYKKWKNVLLTNKKYLGEEGLFRGDL